MDARDAERLEGLPVAQGDAGVDQRRLDGVVQRLLLRAPAVPGTR